MVNKKGDVNWEVIAVILVLAFAIIYFIFLKGFNSEQTKYFDSNACRLSVIKASHYGQGVYSLKDLSCKTQEITVDETDPEAVQQLLAKNLYNCWWMFGQGKVDFLKNFGGEREGICFKCSKLNFINDLDEEVTKKQFEEYLKDNEIVKGVNYLNLFDNIKKDDSIYTIIIAGREDFDLIKQISDFSLATGFTQIYLVSRLHSFIYGTNFKSQVALISKENIKKDKNGKEICKEI